MAKAYFACHISPNFQISLIYAFIECPLSVLSTMALNTDIRTTQYAMHHDMMVLEKKEVFLFARVDGIISRPSNLLELTVYTF